MTQFLSSSSTPDIPDSNGCAHPAASTSRNSCRPPDARGADTPGGDRGWMVGRKKAANPQGGRHPKQTCYDNDSVQAEQRKREK